MINGDKALDGRIMVLTAKGRLTFHEIRNKMADFNACIRMSRILCDLSRATVADLTSIEIEEIITLICQKVNGNGVRDAKSAIVVHGTVDFGLARMFSTFSELADLPVQVKVFRTPEVATEWLVAPD